MEEKEGLYKNQGNQLWREEYRWGRAGKLYEIVVIAE